MNTSLSWRPTLRLLIVSALLIGCGSEKSGSGESSISEVFLQGNPAAIIKGAELDTFSFFRLGDLEKWKMYRPLKVLIFKRVGELSQDGVTVNPAIPVGGKNIEVVESGDSLQFLGSMGNYKLSFGAVGDYYHLKSMSLYGTNFKMKPLHYSLKSDHSAFSILGQTKDALIAMYFVRDEGITHRLSDIGDSFYEFLFGQKKIRWTKTKPLVLEHCKADDSSRSEWFQWADYSLAPWKDILSNDLKLQFFNPDTFPPFSDLNRHCIYVVDQFKRTSPEDKKANPGTTFVLSHEKLGRILDGDIFIWTDEWKKSGLNPLDKPTKLIKTLRHEIGHFLGLGHKFDASVPTIMNYGEERDLQLYDEAAILELYK